MAFPGPSVSVPSLAPYQVSFNGLTLGPGTAYEFQKIEGLDQPDVRTGDAGRARDHGLFIGLDVMGGRTVTLTGDVLTTSASTWSNLAGATVPGGVTEVPLFVNLPNFGTLVTMARPRRRKMPLDIQAALGQLVNTIIEFGSSDPRLYATPTLNPSVSPPGTTAGFSFNLAFPLSFGGGGVAGSLSVVNSGNIETRPLLTITGPCTNPSITNASLPGSPNLTFNVTMAAGDQLILDTDFHTATYFTAGSTIGSTRLYTQARGNQWFTLAPAPPGQSGSPTVAGGVNTIQFLTGDAVATGTLAVQYASAYII